VLQYRDDGYLPEAVVNYLARLGWGHGDDEVFSREQFVEWFDLAGLTPSPGRFDPDKLRWLNHEHIKRLAPADLGARLRPFLAQAGLDPDRGPPPENVAVLLQERSATLVEMADAAHYFYVPSEASRKFAESMADALRAPLTSLYQGFETVPWTREALLALIKSTAASHGLKPPQIMMPLRALVTGQPQTPAIDAVLALLGREATRERIRAGLGI
jgi:glutamyl-tRNA synthetase